MFWFDVLKVVHPIRPEQARNSVLLHAIQQRHAPSQCRSGNPR
jgi:hypothetical protein